MGEGRVDLQRAELAREGDLLGVGDLLAGEHQDRVVHPEFLQPREQLG